MLIKYKKVNNIMILFVFIIINISFTVILISDIDVIYSFLLNLACLIWILNKVLLNKKINLMLASVFTFFYVFMWFAPLIQINYGIFPNTLIVEKEFVIKINFMIFLFLIIYIIFLSMFSNMKINFSYDRIQNNKRLIIISLLLTSVISLVFFPYLLQKILTRVNDLTNLEKGSSLIISKFILKIPIIYIYLRLSSKERLNIKSVLIILTLLFLFGSPFVEKRNALGPIYISILLYSFRRKLNNGKIIIFLISVLLIIFPMAKILTHNLNISLNTISLDYVYTSFNKTSLLNQLNSLDYDAYSNIIATNLYVDSFGITYGKQLLGTLLFFIPRSMWVTKPLSTGDLVGNYLMSSYGMWFNNISNPIISEGFINFGYLGIIAFAIILAFSTQVMYNSTTSNLGLIISIYISMHMIFLLRGDLMSSVAYLVGFLVSLYFTVICYKISHFIKL